MTAQPPWVAGRQAPPTACWRTMAVPVKSAGSTSPNGWSTHSEPRGAATPPTEPDQPLRPGRGSQRRGAHPAQLYQVTGDPAGSTEACGCWPKNSAIPADTGRRPGVSSRLDRSSALSLPVRGQRRLCRRAVALPDRSSGRPFRGRRRIGATDALERCLRVCEVRFAAFPGLLSGLAGLALCSAELGRRLDRPASSMPRLPVRVACSATRFPARRARLVR